MAPRTIQHSNLVEPNLHVPKAHVHDDRYFTETEVNALFAALPTIGDATSTIKGLIRLAGDLAGTAANPTLKSVRRVLNVRDYGATGDGTTDDTSTINAAIAAAGQGDTVYFPPTANKYIYNGSMNPKNDMTLQGDLALISTSAQASGHNGMVNINNRTTVTLDGMRLEANLNGTQSYTCLTSYGHTALRLINCVFTGTTNAFGGLVMLDGQNGSANMDNTLIDRCRFVSAPNSTRAIHLYARNGRTVNRTTVTRSHFEGTKGPAIYLDPYSDIRGTLVATNTFKDLLYGGNSTAVGVALYLGVQGTGTAYDTSFVGNHYLNTLVTSGHQQGAVYFYNCEGLVIGDNTCRGSWTTTQNIAGPCFAPGRISTSSKDITITGNRISGFDAAWDPDSMERVEVANNLVSNCGDGFSLGYGIQRYVSIHHNVYYNSPNRTYLTGILFANSTPLKCQVTDNIVVDDRATPVMVKAILLTGNFNYGDVVVARNRFYVPNGTLTTGVSKLFSRELGSEVVPTLCLDNEIQDASGRYYEAPPSYASDIEITDATKGVIRKSPNGTRWRETQNDDGSVTRTAL